MRSGVRVLRCIAFAMLCAASAQAVAQRVTTELEIAGEVNARLTLSVDGLRAIAVHSARDLPAAASNG